MTAPADREFEILARGFIRDKVVLANWRNGLRLRTNPETGALFTEDEIQRATQPGSRWWIEAQAIDDIGQLDQRRACFLSDQGRIERATTSWLEGYHGRLWGESRLPATGGSGLATVPGTAGTIVIGSTTLPDPAAYKARDDAGNEYQVFGTVVIGAGGTVSATMAAISAGSATNLVAGDVLAWTFRDPGMGPEATVSTDFSGGTDQETDGEFASRMMGNRRHKQAAGNDAHFRAWARESSNAVEDGYVYPCALHAGSTIVAITQKRAGVKGPLARIPSASTLAALIAHITPPVSAAVPARAFVLGVPVNAEYTSAVLRLSLQAASAAGWTDVVPFPAYHATTPTVSNIVVPNVTYDITCSGDATLPGQAPLATLTGADAPQMMVWHWQDSEFELLSIASVQDLGANTYRVTLSSPPTFTLPLGAWVSPAVQRHAIVSQAIVDYFDELGPGDLFDIDADPRGSRCIRFPRTWEERPYRAGAVLATRVIEALGGAAADGTLPVLSVSEPTWPSDIAGGPNMLVPNKMAAYAL